MRFERISVAIAQAALLVACESSEPAAEPVEPSAEPTAAAEEEGEVPTSQPAADPHAGHGAAAGATPPAVPDGAKVSFVAPEAGEVKGPERDGKIVVEVKMGAEGITVEPAGEQKEGSGHHHILIDEGPLPTGTVVPKDETHLHFGKGQTEAEIELAPGKHELTLQFADGLHLSYGPGMAATIEVEVSSNGDKAAPAE